MATFPSGFMYEAAGIVQQPMGVGSPYGGQNMVCCVLYTCALT